MTSSTRLDHCRWTLSAPCKPAMFSCAEPTAVSIWSARQQWSEQIWKCFTAPASYLLRFRYLWKRSTFPDGSTFSRLANRVWSFIESNAASSAKQNHVSLKLILGMPMPLPPLRRTTPHRRRGRAPPVGHPAGQRPRSRPISPEAERLRQSILKQAFSGKLVPSGPQTTNLPRCCLSASGPSALRRRP